MGYNLVFTECFPTFRGYGGLHVGLGRPLEISALSWAHIKNQEAPALLKAAAALTVTKTHQNAGNLDKPTSQNRNRQP